MTNFAVASELIGVVRMNADCEEPQKHLVV